MALAADPTPTGTLFSLWTDRLSVLPIQDKLTGINAIRGVGLPLRINGHWANYLDPKAFLTFDQDPSAYIACVYEMFSGWDLCLMQLLLNPFSHRFIGFWRRGGSDMRDEVRKRWLTGFGEMDFLPGPQGCAFFASMGIGTHQ